MDAPHAELVKWQAETGLCPLCEKPVEGAPRAVVYHMPCLLIKFNRPVEVDDGDQGKA